MKRLLLITALISLSAPAHAKKDPFAPAPIVIHSEEVTAEIVREYIEEKGWCGAPVPVAKPGQIVIYYVRDKDGNCVAQVKVGKK